MTGTITLNEVLKIIVNNGIDYSKAFKIAVDINNYNDQMQKKQDEYPDIKRIHHIVCNYFNVDPEYFLRDVNRREVVQGRQICMAMCKKYTKREGRVIGYYFCGRDHSTVTYAIKTVGNLVQTDHKFASSIEEIENRIIQSMPV